MSTWLAVALSVPLLKKRESPIEPFKRTAELAEKQHDEALQSLECATKELLEELEKKLS